MPGRAASKLEASYSRSQGVLRPFGRERADSRSISDALSARRVDAQHGLHGGAVGAGGQGQGCCVSAHWALNTCRRRRRCPLPFLVSGCRHRAALLRCVRQGAAAGVRRRRPVRNLRLCRVCPSAVRGGSHVTCAGASRAAAVALHCRRRLWRAAAARRCAEREQGGRFAMRGLLACSAVRGARASRRAAASTVGQGAVRADGAGGLAAA